MWIWWVISLLILIACAIFAYRMIVISYQFLPAGKYKLYAGKIFTGSKTFGLKTPDILSLKSKLQKIEENSSFYESQFSTLFQRLQALEELQCHPVLPAIPGKPGEENWKELYYEEKELKEKLENDLDELSQKLEFAENKLNLTEGNINTWAALQSEYDTRLNDLHSKDNNIDLLRRQLNASTGREKELEQSLLSGV